MICVYCGLIADENGYCVNSPTGSHLVAEDEAGRTDGRECCPLCGEELDEMVINGFADHVCGR